MNDRPVDVLLWPLLDWLSVRYIGDAELRAPSTGSHDAAGGTSPNISRSGVRTASGQREQLKFIFDSAKTRSPRSLIRTIPRGEE